MQIDFLHISTDINLFVLAQGNAEKYSHALAVDGIRRRVRGAGSDSAGKDVKAATDSVLGIVRIDITDIEIGRGPRVVEADTELLAGAEQVALRDAGVQQQAIGVRITDAQQQIAGGTFLDADVDVHLIGHARHRRRLHVDVVKETKTLQTHA